MSEFRVEDYPADSPWLSLHRILLARADENFAIRDKTKDEIRRADFFPGEMVATLGQPVNGEIKVERHSVGTQQYAMMLFARDSEGTWLGTVNLDAETCVTMPGDEIEEYQRTWHRVKLK